MPRYIITLSVFLFTTSLLPAQEPPPMPKLIGTPQTTEAKAWKIDEAKLRKTVRLPHIAIEVGIIFNSEEGFVFPGATEKAATEIVALKKALKGDHSDAERYLQLGLLYRKVKDKEEAKLAYQKAEKLFRDQIKEKPADGLLLTRFCESFTGDWKDGEEEALLRQAVRLSPKEWRCWLALGKHLGLQAAELLAGKQEEQTQHRLRLLADKAFREDLLAKSQRSYQEASACFDKAVALTPNEADAWMNRAMFRMIYSRYYVPIKSVGEDKDDQRAGTLSDDTLADFKQVAKLQPASAQALGFVVLYEVLGCGLKREKSGGFPDKILYSVPAKNKQSIEEGLAKLEKLTESQDRYQAGLAAEILAVLQQIVFENTDRALAFARKAVALNPDSESAWDMLCALLAEKKNEECLACCRKRLEHKDSARNRFLLAKSYEKLDQYDKAEEQVRIALKQEPEHPHCNVALAALLLRKGVPAAEVGKQLDRAWQLPKLAESKELEADLLVLRATHDALTGKPWLARLQLKEVLERDKDHKTAKAVLEVLAEAKEIEQVSHPSPPKKIPPLPD